MGLGREKQRLARVLSPHERAALALEMLAAVVDAVRAAHNAAPIIVSPDLEVTAHARRLGARASCSNRAWG